MRVLITGGSGFVGRHLDAHLRQRGDEVVSWGLGDGRDAVDARVDLLDQAVVRSHDLSGLDAVIHLAGLAQVSASFADPAAFICHNSTMQINLFEALMHQDVRPRVLLVSTGAVYGSSSTKINEQTAVDPTSPYSISKLTQELLGAYYIKRGFEVIIARPFNHVGPGQQRGFLVADIASQIAEAERQGGGQVVVGDLTSRRDWTDVRDIVAAYGGLIRDGRSGEIYNVCSGVSRSGEEILTELLTMTTADIEVSRTAALTRPTDASIVTASNEKLRGETGWSPTLALRSTLNDTLNYWRATRPGR